MICWFYLSYFRNYSMLAFCGVGTVSEVVRILFKAVVFNKAVKRFRDSVEQFYSQAFRVFHHQNNETEQGKQSSFHKSIKQEIKQTYKY